MNASFSSDGTPGKGWTFLTTIKGHTNISLVDIPLMIVADLGV